MKKKILLTLAIVSILVCALALSVSAADYDTSREVTLDSGEVVSLYDQEGYALTWYMNGETLTSKRTVDLINVNGSGWISYKTDVEGFSGASTVVVANFQEENYASAITNTVTGFDITYRYSTNLEYIFFADEITRFNQWYTFSETTKLKVAEFTENSQLTSFLQYMFHKAKALKSFYVPDGVTAIPRSDSASSYGFFYEVTTLESVTFGKDSKLTFVGASAFLKCAGLKELTLPDSVTTVESNAIRETGIVNSPFTQNSQLTSLGNNVFYKCTSLDNVIIPKGLTETQNETSNSGGLFNGCTALTTVTFAEGSQMTFIGSRTFKDCSSLVNINLPEGLEKIGGNAFSSTGLVDIKIPNTVKTIANHAFAWCTSLEVIRMGDGFQYFNNTGDNSFTYSTGNVKEIYIPKSFYATAPDTSLGYQVSYAFHGASANCKFFYCGTADEFATAKANFLTQKSATSNNGNFLNAPVITYSEYLANPDDYATGRYVVCEYNRCSAFYENEHVGEEKLVFKGEKLLSSANVCVICTRCNKTETTDTKDALFTNKGYSKSIDGVIMQGFAINKNLVDFYEEWLGTINYGLVAGVYSYVDGEETKYVHQAGELLTLNEGNVVANEKVATVSFDQKPEYDVFEMKLKGLTGDLASTEVFCCAYVVYGNTIYYINNNVVTEGNAGTAVSIGDIQ